MSFVDFSPRDGYKAPTNTCAHPWKTLLSMAGVRLSMDAKDPRMACNICTCLASGLNDVSLGKYVRRIGVINKGRD